MFNHQLGNRVVLSVALQVSERRSGNAFAIKVEIMMQAGELKHALEATTEWRRIDPTVRAVTVTVTKCGTNTWSTSGAHYQPT